MFYEKGSPTSYWPFAYELPETFSFSLPAYSNHEVSIRAPVIKRRGMGISPSYYEPGPWLLQRKIKENRTKRNP